MDQEEIKALVAGLTSLKVSYLTALIVSFLMLLVQLLAWGHVFSLTRFGNLTDTAAAIPLFINLFS